MDPVVLSYMNSLLRQSSHYWILQTGSMTILLGFPWNILPSQFHDCFDDICFISPKVTQVIKWLSTQQRSPCSLSPQISPTRELYFLSINDNSDLTVGGTHWRLLVYLQGKNGFFQNYDSYGSNSFHAEQVAEKLEAFSGRKGNKLAFVEEKPPAQQKQLGLWNVCDM